MATVCTGILIILPLIIQNRYFLKHYHLTVSYRTVVFRDAGFSFFVRFVTLDSLFIFGSFVPVIYAF